MRSWAAAAIEWGWYIGPYRVLSRYQTIGAWCERWMVPRVKMYAAYPFQVSYADWFDRLAAPIRCYYEARDLQDWFDRAGLEQVQLSPTGNYGWRALGMKPTTSAPSVIAQQPNAEYEHCLPEA